MNTKNAVLIESPHDSPNPAQRQATHSPLPDRSKKRQWSEIAQQSIQDAQYWKREAHKAQTHVEALAEALTWIRDVVKERKGTAHWLQMIEDKCRNALAQYDASHLNK